MDAKAVDMTSSSEFQFSGLSEGLYRLEETFSPAGYNRLKKPVYFKIESDRTVTLEGGTMTTVKRRSVRIRIQVCIPSLSRTSPASIFRAQEALTRCDALLANVTCGAVTYATGRKRDYEFVEVKKIADGGH